MKKKISKKPAKLEKPVKKKASPIDELRTQNMRLTQEFDRLATKVASQGDLLYRIHQMLQTEQMMPYEVMVPMPVEVRKPGDTPKIQRSQGVPKGAQEMSLLAGKKVVAAPPNPASSAKMAAFKTVHGSDIIKGYTVQAKVQQTSLGYLSELKEWTFDPSKIGKFPSREDAQKAVSEAKMPEGAKAVIEERRG